MRSTNPPPVASSWTALVPVVALRPISTPAPRPLDVTRTLHGPLWHALPSSVSIGCAARLASRCKTRHPIGDVRVRVGFAL
eukprot:ctg_2884.g364